MTTQAQLDTLINSAALQVVSAMMQVITGMPEGTVPEVVVEAEPLRVSLYMYGPLAGVTMHCQPRMGTLQ